MLSLYFESTPAVLPLLPRVTWLADLLYSLGVDDDATAPTGGYAFVRFTLAAATGSSSRCRSHTSNLFWHTCTCALLLCADSVFSSLLNRFRSRWAPKISRSHARAEFVWMQRRDLSFFSSYVCWCDSLGNWDSLHPLHCAPTLQVGASLDLLNWNLEANVAFKHSTCSCSPPRIL